jgi:hypothetical protein
MANHSEIKSQVTYVFAVRTAAMRSWRFARRSQTSAKVGLVKRAPKGEDVDGLADLGGVVAFGPPA